MYRAFPNDIPIYKMPPADPYTFGQVFQMMPGTLSNLLNNPSAILVEGMQRLQSRFPGDEAEFLRVSTYLRWSTAIATLKWDLRKLLKKNALLTEDDQTIGFTDELVWALACGLLTSSQQEKPVQDYLASLVRHINSLQEYQKPGPNNTDPRLPQIASVIGEQAPEQPSIIIYTKDQLDDQELRNALRHTTWEYITCQDGTLSFQGISPSGLLVPGSFYSWDVCVNFSIPKGRRRQPITQVLHSIERKALEQMPAPTWGALSGALIAVHQAFLDDVANQSISTRLVAPDYYARLGEEYSSPPRPAEMRPEDPDHHIERTAMHLAAGKLLWDDPQERGRTAFPTIWPENSLVKTAEEFMALFDDAAPGGGKGAYPFFLAGKNRRIPGISFLQLLEFDRHGMNDDILQYFSRDLAAANGRSWVNLSAEEVAAFITPSYDPEYGTKLEEELNRKTVQNAQYAPHGAFRMAIPEGTPLRVQTMRIWVQANGFWVMPEGSGMVVFWQFTNDGNGLENTWLPIDARLQSALSVTLSGIRHDLCVAGTKAVERPPSPSDRPARKVLERGKKSPQKGGYTHSIVRLPSYRKEERSQESGVLSSDMELDGTYTWGSAGDIAKIKLSAHQVRGHLRKLQPKHQRSIQAADNAARWGVVIARGYTFVVPHIRGASGKQENFPLDAPQETHVVVTGLASIMLACRNNNA